MSFSSKVVIVTGGSSGIGAATALHFAEEGADVAIVGRNQTKLNNVAAQISKVGKKPLIITADISKDEELNTIVKKTIDKYGRLDVLVNNAGMVRMADVDAANLISVYDEILNTNLRSAVALTNQAAAHLIKTKGNIVNVSSSAGVSTCGSTNTNGLSSYCTSKAGLNHFSRVAALELAAKGVRVNIVSPGPVETDILENAGAPSDWQVIKEMTTLKILTQPVEVADLIVYLASDKARSITGSNYVIDAGTLLK